MALGVVIKVDGSSAPELAEASTIEVQEKMGDTTSFRIRYPVEIRDGDLPALTEAKLDRGSVISILVDEGGNLVCLVKGIVYGQQIHLRHGGADSYVDVLGSDSSIAMDRENKGAIWADLTDSDAVSSIVANYGLQPDIETTAAGHMETKHTLVQRDTDLRFVRRLARRNGCLFWISCDENDTETAHFKRPGLGDPPQSQLVINLDSANLEEININWDIENPTSATATQLDLNSKSSIDGDVAASPLPPLGSQPLSSISSETRSLHLATPVDDVGDLQARSEGALIESGFFLRATGQTTKNSLGKLLRAHTVVTLQGAGSRHSGNYYCSSVRHTIDLTTHRMDFEMLRNGWEG